MRRALFALAVMAAGCSKDITVKLQVRVAGDERKSPLRNPGSPSTPASDVELLKLQVYNDGLGVSRETELTNDFTIADSFKAGALEVSAGDDWHAVLTGTDRFGTLYSMGRSQPFTVPNAGTADVPIIFGIADDFATSAMLDGGVGAFATASVLPDGNVLMVGLGGASIHEPLSGKVCSQDCLMGDLPSPRFTHFAITLTDGKVFVGGGAGPTGAALDDCFVFDAATHTFSHLRVEGFPARVGTAAALLGSGKVLLAGGRGAMPDDAKRVVVVDPATGTMTEAPALPDAVMLATATALSDGTVLIAGGLDAMGAPVSSARVYSNDGSAVMGMATMSAARGAHTATLLADGYVFFFGGRGATGESLSSAEVFTPTGKFIGVDSSNLEPRAGHAAIRLDTGAVLIVGGLAEPLGPPDPARLVPALRFAPEKESGGKYAGTFVPLGQVVARSGAALAALPDFSVVVAGGARTALAADPAIPAETGDFVKSVELFTPCAVKGRACPR